VSPNTNKVFLTIHSLEIRNRGDKMAEKSIPEQIIEEFVRKIARQEILEPEKLFVLKAVLSFDKPKKVDILKAIREDE
jgi:hypothetical protein